MFVNIKRLKSKMVTTDTSRSSAGLAFQFWEETIPYGRTNPYQKLKSTPSFEGVLYLRALIDAGLLASIHPIFLGDTIPQASNHTGNLRSNPPLFREDAITLRSSGVKFAWLQSTHHSMGCYNFRLRFLAGWCLNPLLVWGEVMSLLFFVSAGLYLKSTRSFSNSKWPI